MFTELSHNAKFYILTISITSLVGGGLLIWIIDFIPRKTWLVSSFLLLSIWFAVLGGVLVATEFTDGYVANVVLYAFCQFLFNLGESSARDSAPFIRLQFDIHRPKHLDLYCEYFQMRTIKSI
jgi:PHS family inorganic phosphate transporter-like MFS transporter